MKKIIIITLPIVGKMFTSNFDINIIHVIMCKELKMKPIYIGFPIKDGCHVNGANEGIKKINKNYSLNKIISIEEKEKDLDTIIYYDTLLAKEVNKLQKNNMFPVTIGGDHSLAIGSIAGSSTNNDNLGVIWLDTHPDINTFETTTTFNIHGYPLAASMGFGLNELINLYNNNVKVKYENVVLFGINDIDEPEMKLIDKLNIKYFTLDDIKANGIDFCISETINYLKSKTNNVHLSFDIDSISTKECPGVNVPNRWNNGITSEKAFKSIESFLNNLNIVSMDIVEYNPLNDIDNKSLNIVLDSIRIIDKIKNN